MGEQKLILIIPKLCLVIDSGKGQSETVPLSGQLFKTLYQLFLATRCPEVKNYTPLVHRVAYYAEFPMSKGALKVHVVDLKKILPDGSFENIRGDGYRPSVQWKWVIKTT